MNDIKHKQSLDILIEQKETHTLQALEAGVEIVNSLSDQWDKDWYWAKFAKAFSQLGDYQKAKQVADPIQDRVERAYTFLGIADGIIATQQYSNAFEALNEAEASAFEIEGESYSKWSRAEVLGRIGTRYEILGEQLHAQTLWKEAITSAQSGQNEDNPQELWDCSGVLLEITAYLIEAGLISFARETAQSIRIDSRREQALRNIEEVSK
jgi:tetratricopeptide (TPR) repeat protein